MAYVALYRKFRPQGFKELVGQEHIVRTLLNQLESGRIAHAYLFTGPRGTGKTSTAKLFARAINCAHTVNGDPCGECDACKAYSADDNMDIIEIDAASNNGVDNIRDIREKVVFSPAYGKYKVYIIDEVHMLSSGAFNALLKTLEEPPKHVVFILATTESHKLPATILSRCQRFDFRLLPAKTIFDRLDDVLKQVGADFEKGAIDLIAKSASGGMRDALSLADVCLSYCGNRVTLQDAMNVLGVSDRSFMFTFTEAILKADIPAAVENCRTVLNEGKDIGVFALELMEHLRDVMLCMYAPQSEEIISLPNEIQERLKQQAKGANGERILRAIEILSRLESEIKLHSRPDIQLQTAVTRICSPQTEGDLSALEDRIFTLEEQIKNGVAGSAATAPQKTEAVKSNSKQEAKSADFDVPPWENQNNSEQAKMQSAPEQRQIPTPQERMGQAESAQRAQAQPARAGSVAASGLWKLLLDKVKQSDLPLYMMVRSFTGVEENGKFTVYIPESAKAKEAIVMKNAVLFQELLKAINGKEYTVAACVGTPPTKKAEENDMLKAALDLFS